ncbi:MAG: photosystem II cytochrome PsbV2 [Synechococcales bacterium]|nr:photosystem II cytochrome PsbV2 [Synechococcales bacterium]
MVVEWESAMTEIRWFGLSRVQDWGWKTLIWVMGLWLFWMPLGVAIAAPDPYVSQYLKVPPGAVATLAIDSQTQREVFYAELLQGKKLFEQNCLACHVGGATLSNPAVSLALADLQAATPPRTTVAALVAYMRHPLTYDGQEESFDCREISPSWLSDAELEAIAGFVLRAAQVAPGWGSDRF